VTIHVLSASSQFFPAFFQPFDFHTKVSVDTFV